MSIRVYHEAGRGAVETGAATSLLGFAVWLVAALFLALVAIVVLFVFALVAVAGGGYLAAKRQNTGDPRRFEDYTRALWQGLRGRAGALWR